VNYSYDAAHRLHAMTRRQRQHHKVDLQYGWLAGERHLPNGRQHPVSSYDPKGNVLKRIDGRGIVTDYTYNDPESFLTSVAYVNNASTRT